MRCDRMIKEWCVMKWLWPIPGYYLHISQEELMNDVGNSLVMLFHPECKSHNLPLCYAVLITELHALLI